MRQAYKVWSGIAAGVFCLVAATDLSGRGATPPAGTVASSSSLPAVAAPAAVGGSSPARVLEVIDGDTFRLTSGDEVRVLGIDSCEAGTPGGRRATDAARARLVGVPVTLAAQPGVDRDRYGRMLRYVSAGGSDFAATMVAMDHTAIYTGGRNDASPTVQATLRRIDTNGRTCGAATTTTRSAAPTTTRSPDVDRPRTALPAVPRTATREQAAARSGGGGGYYANCSAARAAGAAPLTRGQAGYRAALDRDGDGVACE
ncbi:micrococcal nuclease [Actinomycetospora succinea]|uniref:Micrococcal nuclease n=1 Tax=Actinomycetospora succinea TaxID=663603 RepID=A0A4R6VMY5_9PSEU|nr:thermonuclease family protein [Actinomycetospora succinea]TDQ63319.1 micrococcal nuclease [Actinomycetospora succinea]